MSASESILDTAVMEELRELGRELEQDVLGEVVEAYRKLAPELLVQMSEAASGGALEALARAAHTLKGGSAQIGARAVAEHARAIEASARAGSDGSFESLVEACHAAYREVDAQLLRFLEAAS